MTALLRVSIRTLAFALCLFSAFAAQAQADPAITNSLTPGTKTVQGVASSTSGTTFHICVVTTDPKNAQTDCSATAAPFTGTIAPTAAAPHFSVTLNSALTAGSYVYLEETVNGANTFSPVIEVAAPGATNEREQTDFVGGTLLNASGGNYSQASLFLALNYDRTLWRPGWYSHKDKACVSSGGFPIRPVTPAQQALSLVLCPATRRPGLNTFFQARLTTIPVNASSTTTPASGAATPAATSVSSFLAQQKSAQFGGGIYAPLLFGKVPSNKEKNATFYIAPIARFGFSTPAGSPSGSSSTATSGGTMTTTTTTLGTSNAASGQLYNYGLVGMRIATADLGPGALHTTHYFDVGVGKYSNLQSLFCKGAISTCQSTTTATTPTTYTDPTKENRVTLLRLEFEGYLEIISANNSSLILGISANTGPGFLSSHAGLDTNNRAAENINFLIGYKFDVSQLLGGISIIGKNP